LAQRLDQGKQNGTKYLSLSIKPKKERGTAKPSTSRVDYDDQIPF
jgi:hypothetical protein